MRVAGTCGQPVGPGCAATAKCRTSPPPQHLRRWCSFAVDPGVARASQPRALLRCPFGTFRSLSLQSLFRSLSLQSFRTFRSRPPGRPHVSSCGLSNNHSPIINNHSPFPHVSSICLSNIHYSIFIIHSVRLRRTAGRHRPCSSVAVFFMYCSSRTFRRYSR